MLNIFNTSQVIHELYDLKGSTIDRSVKEEDRRPGIALKDNDLKRRICIDPELRHLLLEQANLDTQVISSKERLNILKVFFLSSSLVLISS